MHKDRRGYVYETFRDGGRVCRRYVGAGDTVALALKLERLKRKAEERARSQKQAERDEQRQKVEIPVALLDAQTSEVLEALLVAAGYHRPQRGPWRKRRQKPMSNAIEKARQSQIKALESRARNGDVDAAREFWRQVDTNAQTRADMVKQVGDFAALSLRHLLNQVGEGNPLFAEGIRRQLEEMRSELGGIDPPVLERLLIDRVCVCWLQLHYFETQATLAIETDSMEQSLFREKKVDGATRRYHSSIKALAQVRKLQLPTLQINVAEKQVNIFGAQPLGE
jgi:hypothetical protein